MTTGVAGNIYTLALGRQSAKGVAQTSPTYKLKLTSGDLSPARQVIQLAETDSSRQDGKSVVVGAHVEGTPEFYVRPDDFGLLAYAALGANADSGTSPNYIHTATMLNNGNLPYLTIYKAVGNTSLVDEYVDCRVTGLSIKGQAGQVLTVAADIAGLSATFGATDPVLTTVQQTPLVYPNVTVRKNGSAPATVESFQLDIKSNPTILQADTSIVPYDIVPGKLQVSGTFTLLFENDQDYRNFHTGSSSGTAFSTTIFTQTLEMMVRASTFLSVDFLMNSVAYTAYPVLPDVSGAPIRVAAGFQSQPDPATLANYIQIQTYNGVSSY
ncbi:MAG TPA: phage tail tube protein [Gaiellaceae bacterium]|jgi:hypothetical protein|nr:phage tail tube protein [Gaiellaceae bacterium]